MSGTPVARLRTRFRTPLSGGRVRQPFRSPLIRDRPTISPSSAHLDSMAGSPILPDAFAISRGAVLRATLADQANSAGTFSHSADSSSQPSALSRVIAASPTVVNSIPTPVKNASRAVATWTEDAEVDAAMGAVDAEIAELEAAGCNVNDLPAYIDALHGYNEVKDAAQLVMGRIAILDAITVREVHSRYSVLPDEERN